MKVLMFGWEFPPHISGGLGTACDGLTRALGDRGVEVTMVVPRLYGDEAPGRTRLLAPGGVAARSGRESARKSLPHTVAADSCLSPYQNEEGYREALPTALAVSKEAKGGASAKTEHYGRNLFAEIERYATLGVELAPSGRYDVIHAHDWMTFPAAIEAKRRRGLPLVVHVHATEFDRSNEHPNPAICGIEKMGLENADRVIAVSHRTKEIISRRYDIPARRIEVVHNAVDKEIVMDRSLAGKPFGDKLVLFLGRITRQKGPDFFLEAASLVMRRMDGVRFVMSGAGDMLPGLVERMAYLRMADRFHFTGFLQGKRREEMFCMSDLFVMPSLSEPFGITPLEAMKYGVPVIVSKESGVAEILPHAVKVEPGNVEALAGKMMELLKNPELLRRLRDMDAKVLKKIDWKEAAGKVGRVYGDLKNKAKPIAKESKGKVTVSPAKGQGTAPPAKGKVTVP